MSNNPCDIYGCNRSLDPVPDVTVTIKGVDVDVKVCSYHKELFATMDTDLYSVGYTFTNDIEIRLHPATPLTEPESPPPA